MSIIHLNHIQGEINRRIIEHLDTSDIDNLPEQ